MYADGPEPGMVVHRNNRPALPDEPRRRTGPGPIRVHQRASACICVKPFLACFAARRTSPRRTPGATRQPEPHAPIRGGAGRSRSVPSRARPLAPEPTRATCHRSSQLLPGLPRPHAPKLRRHWLRSHGVGHRLWCGDTRRMRDGVARGQSRLSDRRCHSADGTSISARLTECAAVP